MTYTFRYIEAPIYWVPLPDDPPAVFLAGGITNCARWHDDALVELRATGVDMVVLNPNRRNFPIHDPDAGKEQVWWEQHHLHLPETVTLMWFPESDASLTTQPIAQFELGQCLNPATLAAGRRVVVGADPGYPRVRDVELMMEYHRPDDPVYSTLPEFRRGRTCGRDASSGWARTVPVIRRCGPVTRTGRCRWRRDTSSTTWTTSCGR